MQIRVSSYIILLEAASTACPKNSQHVLASTRGADCASVAPSIHRTAIHLEILPDRSTGNPCRPTSGVSTAKSSAGESSPAKSGWRMRTSPTKKLGLKGSEWDQKETNTRYTVYTRPKWKTLENIGKLRLEVTTPKKSIQIIFSSRAIVILLETEAATSPAPVQIRAKTGRSPTMLASI